ncbi:hypothetical protein [Amycolatopsis silviterrae]|uniref:NUDIX hydrolase n=1 Tax=Amycolatopsis silviterrae TaxID=1656914 RepID=A0ABW5HCA5_9PSEU
MDQPPETTKWTIRGERIVDDTRRLRLSVASVLMMWRHRWIFDRRAWELPGGYLDPRGARDH